MSTEELQERVLKLLQSTNTEMNVSEVADTLDERSTRVYNALMTLALDQKVNYDPKTRRFKAKGN